MVPYAGPSVTPTATVGFGIESELPRSLRGDHPACGGAGCPSCLDTGTNAALWVYHERDREAEAVLRGDDPDLLAEFAATVADIATHPQDRELVLARVAKMRNTHECHDLMTWAVDE